MKVNPDRTRSTWFDRDVDGEPDYRQDPPPIVYWDPAPVGGRFTRYRYMDPITPDGEPA